MTRIAVVTDSTALLPAEAAYAPDLSVVPLHVAVGDAVYPEGSPEVSPAALALAMHAKKAVSTSQVTPMALAQHYAELAVLGYDEIVSVHLSSGLSGTVQSARHVAELFAVPIHVVDSLTAGPALGGAVAAALRALARGESGERIAEAASAHAAASTTYVYVDSLDQLRRGGRIGAAAALVGAALAVKPILTVAAGKLVVKERIRSSAKALQRIEELCVEAVGSSPRVVTVAHFGAPDRAEALAAYLRSRLGDLAGDIAVGEVGAVLGAHVGPGMVAVSIGPADDPAADGESAQVEGAD